MKKINYILTLCLLLSVVNISCSKTAGNNGDPSDSIFNQTSIPGNQGSVASRGSLNQTVIGDLGADLTNLTFCSARKVELCAGQSIKVGYVTVQTAINGNTYITYTLTGNWYFKELHLYAGEQADIPTSGGGNAVPGQFPYTKTFLTPYNVQKYTFVISGLDDVYAVAAHASVIKMAANGNILQQETAWGDGCTGNRINTQGAWGTFMNYVGAGCTIAAAVADPANLCSYSVDTYFWTNPANRTALTWRSPVEVGMQTYGEAEAREIANSASNIDSKFAFMRAATIKLSKTEYQLSPMLNSAMITIEDWLKTQPKLTPNNPAPCNSTVRNAATIIDTWISAHLCSIE